MTILEFGDKKIDGGKVLLACSCLVVVILCSSLCSGASLIEVKFPHKGKTLFILESTFCCVCLFNRTALRF